MTVICQRNLGNLSLCNHVLRELGVITIVKFTRFPIYKCATTEDRHPSVPGQNIFQYLTSLDIQTGTAERSEEWGGGGRGASQADLKNLLSCAAARKVFWHF